MTAQPSAPAAPADAAEAPAGNQPEAPAAPAQPAAPESPAQPEAPTAKTWNPDAWDGKVESLPAAAQKIIGDLRKADGDERVAKKTLDAIMSAITPEADTPADPAELSKKLTEQTANHQTLQREHQVLLSAVTAGADHAALLDSRSFLAKVADLDPTAEDFHSKVDDAVKKAIADNPKLKAGRAPGASSVDHPGGSGEGDVTAEQFKKMNGAERNALAQTNPTLYNRLAGRS